MSYSNNKEGQRRAHLKHRYGISPEKYEELLLSNGSKCWLCQELSPKYPLEVDHDHETGEVRGLLCKKCNTHLGGYEKLKNNPKLITYLKPTSPERRTIALVRWRDAQDHAEKWVDSEDAEKFGDKECIVESVGYVIGRTDKYLTLGADWDSVDKDYGRVTKIPTGMVISITDIE